MNLSASYAPQRMWFSFFPVDGNGVPTSDAAYHLIKFLFVNHDRTFSSDELAGKLMLRCDLVDYMCRQLEAADFVIQVPTGTNRYRYLLDSPNSEMQRKLEIALLDYPIIAAMLKRPAFPPE